MTLSLFLSNGASQHVLLHMKPSVSDVSLARKLCQIFEIPENDSVITKTMVQFLPDLCPLTDPILFTYFLPKLHSSVLPDFPKPKRAT